MRYFPSVERIKEWMPAQIVGFLESEDELYLTNNDIEMIKKNNIANKRLSFLAIEFDYPLVKSKVG